MTDFGGRYRRVRLLGAGGMGEVWLAHDEELDDRPVAVKIMHSRMLADAEDAARFQREMRLAAHMQHPNIMTVYTTGADNGAPFMVMEHLAGRDLSHVTRGALDASQVARIGRDACAALAYAHAQGVVHRDIKPGNLFLCDSGLVKVTDFGIAKAVSGTRLSATGTLVGTLPYMAPEQWLGQPAAFGNDIWAVGCVLYELLTGRLPRTYATPPEYVAAAARRELVVPLEQLTSVPPWLADAVMAMLRPSPGERPSAAECVQLLSGMPAAPPGGAASATATVGQRPAGISAPRPARRKRLLIITCAVIAAVAAGGGTWAGLASRSPSSAANGCVTVNVPGVPILHKCGSQAKFFCRAAYAYHQPYWVAVRPACERAGLTKSKVGG